MSIKRVLRYILVSMAVMSLLAFCFDSSYAYAKTANTAKTEKKTQASVSTGSRSSASSSTAKSSSKSVQEAVPRQEAPINVVFLGDSNYSFGRESFNSVPEQTQEILNGFYGTQAKVYNLSIGGTTATVLPGANKANEAYDPAYLTKMNGISLVNLVDILTGKAVPDPLSVEPAWADYNNYVNDRVTPDWFVLGYGTNDYNGGVQVSGASSGKHTYVSALRYSIMRLKRHFPNAHILVCSPVPNINMASGWDGDLVDKGAGTLVSYVDACLNVADETGVYSLDSHRLMGINQSTAADYLADGCHLNTAGRWKYAFYISNSIFCAK